MDTCVIGTVCAPTSADGSSAKCVEEFSQGVIHLFYYHALLISSPVRSSLLLFSNTHQGSGAFCSVDIMCGEGLTVCFSCFSAPLEYLFQSFIFFSSDIFSSVTMKIHRRLLRAQRWHQAHSRAAICQRCIVQCWRSIILIISRLFPLFFFVSMILKRPANATPTMAREFAFPPPPFMISPLDSKTSTKYVWR